jgi:hypothetical protein
MFQLCLGFLELLHDLCKLGFASGMSCRFGGLCRWSLVFATRWLRVYTQPSLVVACRTYGLDAITLGLLSLADIATVPRPLPLWC